MKLPSSDADIDRAHCDAEHVSLAAPGRQTQDIPKKTRRFVEFRDGKRCRIPGCRSSRNLDIHHIEHREDGGSHEPPNLIVICGGHHDAHHRGVLWISGTAANLVVKRFDDPAEPHAAITAKPAPPAVPAAHVGAEASPAPARSKSAAYAAAETRTNAITALVTLGWDRKQSCASVDSALRDLGGEAELMAVIKTALQRCQ